MATTQVRVPGGGNTFMVMGTNTGVRVAFLANVNDTPGRSVGSPTPIHPVGSAYPVEIATPFAQGMGTLVLTVWAQWGTDGWVSAFANDKAKTDSPWNKYSSKHGENLEGTKVGVPCDLREVLEAQRETLGDSGYLKVQKYERGRNGNVVRVKSYEKCVITDIDATDNVSVETMEQRTRITMNYAYVTVVGSRGVDKSYDTSRYIDL